MTILSKIALKIEIIVRVTMVLAMSIKKQYNSYKDQNKSGDNDSLEKSVQAMTDLLKAFIKKTSHSHSTYYKPSQKYPANRN